MSLVKGAASVAQSVVGSAVDATTNDTKTPKAKSLAQESFPDMPKDKALKAKSVNDKEVPLTDIGRAGKKSSNKQLSQTKDPIAMPPFTSGIIGAATAIGAAGSGAVAGG